LENNLTEFTHHVSGFFVKREESPTALSKLNAREIAAARLSMYERAAEVSQNSFGAKSNVTLKNLIADGTIGAAIGVGIGVVAEGALVIAKVSLLIAQELINEAVGDFKDVRSI
jgi:hypothetical protein